MPRVGTDNELLAEVLALEAVVGNKSKLAVMLGVDKTRETIRKGLMRHKNETSGSTEKVNASLSATLTGNMREDMQMLRSLCTTVLTVLDGYENLMANGMQNN